MAARTPTKKERQDRGKLQRKRVGRSEHGEWRARKKGRSAFKILEAAEAGRLPHLVALKYQRMEASPFAYFRGAAPVMANDLGEAPNTGIRCQLCGDAHVRNIGAYAAPDGRMVFDLNDFDETVVGPFEWDVKRMAASLHVAGRAGHLKETVCREAVRLFARRYVGDVRTFAAMPVIEIARYQIHRAAELATMQTVFAKAERSTPLHLRDVLTVQVGQQRKGKAKGSRRFGRAEAARRIFRSEPPELQRLERKQAAEVLEALGSYRESLQLEQRHLLERYRAVDVAFKVVGTGSVGLRDYVIYLEGNGPDDPLFLQVKQEVAPAWAPYLKKAVQTPRSVAGLEGRRVVNGQRAMQVQSDPFLGFTHLRGCDYLVRQLNDHKGSVDLGTLDREVFLHYADLCGELLARGHARSGDPDALAGYLGGGSQFERAIATFAARYADQTEEDWKELIRVRGEAERADD